MADRSSDGRVAGSLFRVVLGGRESAAMRHRVMRLLGRLPVAGRIASGDHGLVSAVSARATVGECDRFVELCERCDIDQSEPRTLELCSC